MVYMIGNKGEYSSVSSFGFYREKTRGIRNGEWRVHNMTNRKKKNKVRWKKL